MINTDNIKRQGNYARKRTSAKDERVCRLYEMQFSISDISRLVKLSRRTVKTILTERGMSRNS